MSVLCLLLTSTTICVLLSYLNITSSVFLSLVSFLFSFLFFFFFQAEDGIRDSSVTGVQTCALPISAASGTAAAHITYVSDTPGAAKIVGGGTAADAMGWWNKGNYVDIKGFEIDGSGSQATSWRFGFYGSGSHDTFQGNTVHDILTDATAFPNPKSSPNGPPRPPLHTHPLSPPRP